MDEKIFISYSRKDKDVVFALVDRIEKELKVKCWIDLDGIESGQQFADVIMSAIERCEIVLFMMSDNSLNSSYAKKEIHYAHLLKRKIVPVLLVEKELHGWFAFEFGTTDYIVAVDDEQMAKLFRNLRSWLPDIVMDKEDKAEPVKVTLKVLSNCDCRILVDCEEAGLVYAGRLFKYQLPVGDYYTEFIPVDNPEDRLSYDIALEQDKLMKVRFETRPENDGKFPESDEIDKDSVIEEIKVQDEAESYSEQSKLVPCLHMNCIGFADLNTGKFVVPGKYQDGHYRFIEGYTAVKLNDVWGYVDYEGNEVIQPQYNTAGAFSEGLAVVSKGEKVGFIDKSGNVVIDFIYDSASSFSENRAIVSVGAETFYIDKNGKRVLKLQYDKLSEFVEGLAGVCRGDKWGYIDKSGQEVIPCIYEEVSRYRNGLAVVKSNGKAGVINKVGDIIIPFVESSNLHWQYDGFVWSSWKCKGNMYYDYAGQEILSKRGEVVGYGDDIITVKKYDLYGCVDKDDNIIIPLQYDDAASFYEGLIAVKKGDCWGYIDKSNHVVIPFVFEEAWEFCNGYANVKFNGKEGVIDKTGTVIIPFKYDNITNPFYYSDIADCHIDGDHYLVDKLGNTLLASEDDYCLTAHLGSYYLANASSDWVPIISSDNKIGYCDKYSGEITIPCLYGQAYNFDDDLAWVYIPEQHKMGCIDVYGNLYFTLDESMDSVGPFTDGSRASYKVAGKNECGYFDRSGTKVIKFIGDMCLGDFNGGVAPVRNQESAWLIDENGSKISDMYDDMDPLFNDGLIVVKGRKGFLGIKSESKCGYLDQKGKLVIPLKYDDACAFSNGLASVKLKDKWGCIDRDGNVVKPFIYDWIGPFKEGLALVELGSNYGFVDRFRLVIPMTPGSALDFSEGFACVKSNSSDKYGYINRTGRLIVPHQFDDAASFSGGLARVKQNGLWGYVDYWGRVVIPCQYGQAEDFKDGLAYVQKDGKYGYINKRGEEIIECKHSSLTTGLVDYGLSINSDEGYIVDRFGNESPLL